jgi:autotransporter-associated beta strand protein
VFLSASVGVSWAGKGFIGTPQIQYEYPSGNLWSWWNAGGSEAFPNNISSDVNKDALLEVNRAGVNAWSDNNMWQNATYFLYRVYGQDRDWSGDANLWRTGGSGNDHYFGWNNDINVPLLTGIAYRGYYRLRYQYEIQDNDGKTWTSYYYGGFTVTNGHYIVTNTTGDVYDDNFNGSWSGLPDHEGRKLVKRGGSKLFMMRQNGFTQGLFIDGGSAYLQDHDQAAGTGGIWVGPESDSGQDAILTIKSPRTIANAITTRQQATGRKSHVIKDSTGDVTLSGKLTLESNDDGGNRMTVISNTTSGVFIFSGGIDLNNPSGDNRALVVYNPISFTNTCYITNGGSTGNGLVIRGLGPITFNNTNYVNIYQDEGTNIIGPNAKFPVAGNSTYQLGTRNNASYVTKNAELRFETGNNDYNVNAYAGFYNTGGTPGTRQFTFAHGSGTITLKGVVDLGSVAGYYLNLSNAQPVVIEGTLSGSSGINKIGAGFLTLSGNASYSGATRISDGTLKLGSTTTAGSGIDLGYGSTANNVALYVVDGKTLTTPVTVTAGTGTRTIGMDTTGTATLDANIALNKAVILTAPANSTITVADGTEKITGTGSLTKDGAGTVIIAGTNSYSGGTTISAGTLQIGAGGTSGAVTNNITDNAALIFNRADTYSFGGVISGSGTVTKQGAGTLTLTNISTYSNSTTISGGTLALSSSGSLNATSSVSIAAGATFDVSAKAAPYAWGSSAGLTASGTGTNIGTTAATIKGPAGGTVNLGSRPITLNYDGVNPALYISQGTLALNGNAFTINGTALAAGAYTIIQQASGTVSTSGTYSVSGTAIGAGTGSIWGTGGDVVLVIAGTKTWDGQGTNDNWTTKTNWDSDVGPGQGNTLNFSGTTRLTPNNVFPAGVSFPSLLFDSAAGAFTLSGTQVKLTSLIQNFSANAQIVNLPIDLDTGVTLQLDTTVNSGDLTLGGVIGGAGGIRKISLAATTTLILSGANTYSGATAVYAGNVSINSIKTNGSTSASSFGKPSAGNGDIQFGAGNLNPSTLIYTGTGDTTDRGIRLNTSGLAGTLTVRQSGSGLLKFIGSFLATASGTQRRLILDGSTAGTGEWAGVLTNTTDGSNLQMVKNGTGSWTLSGSNGFSGTTTINAGVLRITHTNGLGTTASGTTVADGATLELGVGGGYPGEALTIAGQGVTNSGALRNQSGASSLRGAVTLSADARINNDSSQLTYANTNDAAGNTLYLGGSGIHSMAAGAVITNVTKTTGNGALRKTGSGRLDLRGGSWFTGNVSVDEGELRLALAGDQLPAGGTLSLSNNITLSQDAAHSSIGKSVDIYGDITLGRDAAGSVTLTNAVNLQGATRTLTTVSTNTISGPIGNGGLTKAGSSRGGVLVLSGANTYTSDTRIAAGSLMVSNQLALQSSTLDMNASDAGSVTFGTPAAYTLGGLEGLRNLAIASKTLSVGKNNESTTYSGVLSGAGGALTKIGNGMLTLSGANSYDGATTISTGTLQLAVANERIANSSAVSISAGATFDLNDRTETVGSIAGAGAITLGAGALTAGGDGSSTEFSGIMSETGSFTKQGAGMLTLSGSNTYSGGTTISLGTLSIGNGGTTGSVAGNITDNAALVFNRADALLSYTSQISGSGTVTKQGAGTVILGGNNSYTGLTTVSAGALKIAHINALGTTNGGTIVNSLATLQIEGGIVTTTEALTLNGFGVSGSGGALRSISGNNTYAGLVGLGGATRINSDADLLTLGHAGTITGATLGVTVGGNGDTTINSIIGTTTGTLTKDGSGTLTLSGANTYQGLTTISAGVVVANHDNALGSVAGGVTVANNAALQLAGARSIGAEALTLNGTGISNDGALRNPSGNDVYAGLVTLGSATRINSDADTLTLNNAGTITGPTYGLTVGGAGNTTINGIIGTTSGTVTKDGAGTLTLSGASTYTGVTTIKAGTVLLGANAPSGAAGTLGQATSAVLLGDTTGSEDASLLINGAFTVGRAITVQSGSSGSATLGGNSAHASSFTNAIALNKGVQLTAIAGGTSTFSGVLSGVGSVSKEGAGTVNLSGINTYGGLTTISSGTLQVGAGGTTGTLGTNNVIDNSSLVFNRTNDLTVANVISGTGSLTKANTNNAVILTGNNSYGATIISGGTLQVGDGGTTGTLGTGNVTNNGTLAIFRSADLTLGNNISGTGDLMKHGTNTLALGGANSYSGLTTISNGTLAISAANNIGNSSGIMFNGFDSWLYATADGIELNQPIAMPQLGSGPGQPGHFLVDAGDTLTLHGVISGWSTFQKYGDGTVVITATNTHTGKSQIYDGTMRLGPGAQDSWSPNVDVLGGTYDLNGNIQGYSSTVTLGTVPGEGSLFGTILSSAGIGTLDCSGNYNVLNGLVSANLTGAAVLTKSSIGTVTLSGSNSYNGVTTLQRGTLIATTYASVLGTSNLVLDSVGLSPCVLELNNDTGLNFGRNTTASNVTIKTGRLTGGAGVTHTLGTLGMGANTLSVAVGSNVTSAVAGLTFGATTLSANGAVFDTASGVNLTLGALGGNYAWSKTNSGTLTLATAAPDSSALRDATLHGGLTVIEDGNAFGTGANGNDINVNSTAILELNGSGLALNNSQLVYLNNGGTLRSDGSNSSYAKITAGAAANATLATVNAGDTFTIGNGANDVSGGDAMSVLHVAGPGTVLLALSCDFAGNWSADSGTLLLQTSDSALGQNPARSLTLNGGNMRLNRDGNTSYTGGPGNNVIVSASSTITSDRTTGGNGFNYTFGNLSLGANTLNIAKGANVSGGAAGVTFGNTTLSGPPTLDVASGAKLTLAAINNGAHLLAVQGAGDTDVVGAIGSGAGGVTKAGTGLLTLTGSNTFSGALNINSGLVQIGTNGTSGSVDSASIVNDGALTFYRSDTSTYAGVISGAGTLTNLAGTLTLSNVNTYNGPTTVKAGTLIMSGSAANSAVTVWNGATIKGDGAVGALTVSNNATVAPGNSTVLRGSLTVASLDLKNGAKFRVKIGDVGAGTVEDRTDRDYIENQGAFSNAGTTTIQLDSTNTVNWITTTDHVWTVISGGITATNGFVLDASTYWTNDLAGGGFALSAADGKLKLIYDDDLTPPMTNHVNLPGAAAAPFVLTTNGTAQAEDIRGFIPRRTGSGTNVVSAITDAELASAGDLGLQFVLGARDVFSGVARGNAGNTNTVMSFSLGDVVTGNFANYNAGLSTVQTTTNQILTNFWTFANGDFPGAIITSLMAANQPVWMTVPDTDNDRLNDRMTLYGQQVGYLRVADDDAKGPVISAVSVEGAAAANTYFESFEPATGWTNSLSFGGAWTFVSSQGTNVASGNVLWGSLDPKVTGTRRIGLLTNVAQTITTLQLPPVANPGTLTAMAGRFGDEGAENDVQIQLDWLNGASWTGLGMYTVTNRNPEFEMFSWNVEQSGVVTLRLVRVTTTGPQVYVDDVNVTPIAEWMRTNQISISWSEGVEDYSAVDEYRVVAPATNSAPPTTTNAGAYAAANVTNATIALQGKQGVLTGYVVAIDNDNDRPGDRALGNVKPIVVKVDITPPTGVPDVESTTETVDDPTTQLDLSWVAATVGPDDPDDANHPTHLSGDRNILSPWRSYKVFYSPFNPLEVPENDQGPGHGDAFIFTNFIATGTYTNWPAVTSTNSISDPSSLGYQSNYYALTNVSLAGIRLYDLDFDQDYAVVIVGLDKAGNEGPATASSWATNNTIRFSLIRGTPLSKTEAEAAFPGSPTISNTDCRTVSALYWTAAGPTNEVGVYSNVTKDYDLIGWDANRFQEASNNAWQLLGTIRTNWFVDDGGHHHPRGQMRFYRASYKDRWKTTNALGRAQRPMASEEVYAQHNVVLSGGPNFVALHGVPYVNTFRGVFGGTESFPGGASAMPASGATVVEFYSAGTNAPTSEQYFLNTSGHWIQVGGGDVTVVQQSSNFFSRGFSITLPDTLPTNYIETTALDYRQLDVNGNPLQVPAKYWEPIVQVPTNGFSQTIYTGSRNSRVSTLMYNVASLRLPVSAHPSEMRLVESGFVKGSVGMGDEIYTMNTATKSVLGGSTIYCEANGTWRFAAGNGLVPSGYFKPNDVIVIVSRNGGVGNSWNWSYSPTNFYALPDRWMGQ